MADILGPLIPKRHRTQRLVLRRPEPCDLEPYIDFSASQRSAMALGPMDRPEAFKSFCLEMALWDIKGFGNYTLLRHKVPIGLAGVWHPEGWDEAEIGWLLWEGYEGRGYATEAAKAVRDLLEDLGWPPPVSYIDPANHRAKAVARRLGARLEQHHPRWPDTEIWRHRAGVAPAP
ncbi:GNAT family N-acetyltransferase [Limimaricola soesokkakensis]|uniref:GNAT family N-acetyltransferase n=1 Tax=Limimaricola soesokkakensis TaxID=1343159 RepID=UPI003513EFEF